MMVYETVWESARNKSPFFTELRLIHPQPLLTASTRGLDPTLVDGSRLTPSGSLARRAFMA